MDTFLQKTDSNKDFYKTLGCDPSSSEEQIIAEFRAKAKVLHPDKVGEQDEDTTKEFQDIQEAKETLLDRTKRALYDKWRSAGISISFEKWADLKNGVQSTMHWAVPKNERMLPEGEESNLQEPADKDNPTSRISSKPEMPLKRQDSQHPTMVMVNKWGEEDIRKKFRNYEI